MEERITGERNVTHSGGLRSGMIRWPTPPPDAESSTGSSDAPVEIVEKTPKSPSAAAAAAAAESPTIAAALATGGGSAAEAARLAVLKRRDEKWDAEGQQKI